MGADVGVRVMVEDSKLLDVVNTSWLGVTRTTRVVLMVRIWPSASVLSRTVGKNDMLSHGVSVSSSGTISQVRATCRKAKAKTSAESIWSVDGAGGKGTELPERGRSAKRQIQSSETDQSYRGPQWKI